MPKKKHRERYRWPRKGQDRKTLQPTVIEKLPGELRDRVRKFVDDARNARCRCGKQSPHWHSWEGLEEAANLAFALQISASAYRRDYEIYVERVRRENLDRNQASRNMAKAFAERGIEDLPAAAMNALAGEQLAALNDKDPEVRQAAMLSFGVVLAKLLTAQAAQQRVGLEKEKIAISRERLEQMRAKITGVRDAIGGKKKISNEELAKKLDEIYGLTQPNAA